jgi:hypothetical protein
MRQHIEFMQAFLSGLRSLPNPDKYTQAYIRAFEVCLYSAKKHEQKSNHKTNGTNLELPGTFTEIR